MISNHNSSGSQFIRIVLIVVIVAVIGIVAVVFGFSNGSELRPKSTESTESNSSLKIGDYIQFGQYRDLPLLWRVIHVDEQANPVLFSDRIFALKAFDADNGNQYELADLRQWLNNDETGFLADSQFSQTERSWINPFSHRVLLTEESKQQAEVGRELHAAYIDIDHVIYNYDQAYAKTVTDNVFLLSVKQLKEWVYDQRDKLGKDYHVGKITQSLYSESEFDAWRDQTEITWRYWLNSPFAVSNHIVRTMDGLDGVVGNIYQAGHYANEKEGGVRPALQLNLSATPFATKNTPNGDGSLRSPYILAEKSLTF
jgi:hypothetical protein